VTPQSIAHGGIPAPIGAGVILQVQLVVRALGTGYVEINVDGNVEAKIPVTLLPASAKAQAQK
jgi:hypothetical protein